MLCQNRLPVAISWSSCSWRRHHFGPGFQVYNAYELHSLKKKVDKLKNIVTTVASEEVVLHNDLTVLVRVTNCAFAKLTSLIKCLETLLHGTVDTLF